MGGDGITGIQLIKSMIETLPEDSVIVDDSQCMGYFLKRYYNFNKFNLLYGSMASHIGWALPAALGVKLVRLSEIVVCLVGDGSFMFGLHALASSSTYHIPLLVIIVNNTGYTSLKIEMASKWKLSSKLNQTLSLNNPYFDYSLLANSIGLDGINVTCASELVKAIKDGVFTVKEKKKTCVINVVTSNNKDDWEIGWFTGKKVD